MVLDNSIYPILDDNGNVEKLAVFTSDITKRKQAEFWLNGINKLKESLLVSINLNEQLKLITNSIVNTFELILPVSG